MKVNIFDGHYLLHRILHIGTFCDMETTTGFQTGGLYGVMKTIFKLIDDFPCQKIVVCWDSGHSRRRKALYDNYKGDLTAANTVLSPEEAIEHERYWELFNSSYQMLETVLPIFGVRSIRLYQREADDICGLVRMLNPNEEVLFLTDDSDYFQLIDSKASVYRPIAEKLITAENLQETTGLRTPFECILYKSIIGGHDNVPGVKGVGDGTVRDAIGKFGKEINIQTIPEFIDFCRSGTTRMQKIGENEDQILKNMLISDIKLEEFSIDEISFVQSVLTTSDIYYRQDEALEVLGKYEMSSIEGSSRYWEPILEHLV